MGSHTKKQTPGPAKKAPLSLLLLILVAVGAYFIGRQAAAPASSQAIAAGRPAATGQTGLSAAAPVIIPGPTGPEQADKGRTAAEKAQKLRALLTDARKALSAGQYDQAKELAGEAFALNPDSQTAAELMEEAEDGRLEAEQKERERKVDEFHREGLKALSRGDTEKALEQLQAARQLDPANSKTFRLMEQAFRQKDEREAKVRREAFEKGEPLSGAETAQPASQQTQGGEQTAVAESFVPEGEYSVQPDDVLQVTVFEEPDLSTRVRVARSGEITFPLLGQVQVAGMSVTQVQQKMTGLLEKDFLVHPQVQVFVDKPRNVFVTGQVHKPGSYPVSTEKSTTVMEMIALAGGFTQDADLNGTRIIRMVNGKKETIRVRVTDVVRKGDKSKDEPVRAEDIIFVPESFF